MREQLTSANFSFLAAHDAQLVRLGVLAERYFKEDPATSLIKLRQYGETLAQLVAAKAGLFRDAQEPQADLLRLHDYALVRFRFTLFFAGHYPLQTNCTLDLSFP